MSTTSLGSRIQGTVYTSVYTASQQRPMIHETMLRIIPNTRSLRSHSHLFLDNTSHLSSKTVKGYVDNLDLSSETMTFTGWFKIPETCSFIQGNVEATIGTTGIVTIYVCDHMSTRPVFSTPSSLNQWFYLTLQRSPTKFEAFLNGNRFGFTTDSPEITIKRIGGANLLMDDIIVAPSIIFSQNFGVSEIYL